MPMSEPDKIQRTDNGKEEKSAGELVTVTLNLGDCVEVMRSMPDNSVDAIVTDPPYELGFMGKSWDNTGIAYQIDLWQEVLRVLKPGGHLLSFGGTRTYHRMACSIEDAGFEIRDQIQWIYGSGFPKSLDISKAIDKMAGMERETGEPLPYTNQDIRNNNYDRQDGVNNRIQNYKTLPATPEAQQWDGWGTALKPANEPIVLARKPLIGTVARNVLEWGTGGLNIDGCRVGTEGETPKGSENPAKYDYERGAIMPGRNGGNGGNVTPPAGRFPANVIHDGSDEVVAMFPNETQRFFYCAKASRSERNAGLEGMEERDSSFRDGSGFTGLLNGVEYGRHTKMQNHHPTVKPIALMRYLCKLVTPPNGTVLDPFMGSGTTGCAAVQEGFNFIGIEREREYYEIAEKRIADAQQQMRLPI